MKWLQRMLTRLNGLYYPQEYLCLNKETFDHPLFMYLASDGRATKDITDLHLFIGYHPLVLALDAQFASLPAIEIIFSQQPLPLNEIVAKKDAIARISLQKAGELQSGDTQINFYEGTQAAHRFVSSFHQYIINTYNELFQKKKSNVFLHKNLYKQVQVAYSIPRTISLVTVAEGRLFNCFPTDLHGQVSEHLYIISLRHEGKACRQVLSSGKILLAEMSCTQFKTVYSLGKNHMQDPRPRESFPFSELNSANFALPIPNGGIAYRELELLDSFNHGIHKIMLFHIRSRVQLVSSNATLAHIHNVYATWRRKKGLAGNYFMR